MSASAGLGGFKLLQGTRSTPSRWVFRDRGRGSNEPCRPLRCVSLLLHLTPESLRPSECVRQNRGSAPALRPDVCALGQLNNPQLRVPRVCRSQRAPGSLRQGDSLLLFLLERRDFVLLILSEIKL